jgi:hypothetical protein
MPRIVNMTGIVPPAASEVLMPAKPFSKNLPRK